MSKYVWCEDIGSGYTFWCYILSHLCPEVIVESKGNNSSLRKAVERLADDGNDYYIFIDHAIDNPDVLREVKKLKDSIGNKHNVHEISIHSFEFALLSFNRLEQWVFAEIDDLKKSRRTQLDAKDIFVEIVLNGGEADRLIELKNALNYNAAHNSEQIAAKLLAEITLNTGFETTKKKLGECFIVDCCDWESRQEDDLCGLDATRLSAYNKAKTIVMESVLWKAFLEGGLVG